MQFKSSLTALFLGAAMAVPAAAAPVQWAVNGHWYELSDFADAQDTFAGAVAGAAAKAYMGMTGYLATITSQGEQDFLNTLVNTTAWLGGSDMRSEGNWQWVTGPEAGTAFSFINWANGEPNSSGDEDGLLGWWVGDKWNDISDPYGPYKYVIEYSPTAEVPVPAALPLLAFAVGAVGFAARRRKAG